MLNKCIGYNSVQSTRMLTAGDGTFPTACDTECLDLRGQSEIDVICGFHGGEFDDYVLLGFDTVQARRVYTTPRVRRTSSSDINLFVV